MANRKELKARLEAEGVWLEFLELRDQLKEKGMAPKAANDRAVKEIDAALRRRAEYTEPPATTASADQYNAELALIEANPWGQLIAVLVNVLHVLDGGEMHPEAPPACADLLAWAQESEGNEAAMRHCCQVWRHLEIDDPDTEFGLLLQHGEASLAFLQRCFNVMGLEPAGAV